MMVYKVALAEAWSAASKTGAFPGAGDDLRDGFIHFSTAAQLPATLEAHFLGQEGLLLLAVEADELGDELRWEPARDGADFPHLYRDLYVDEVVWARPLALDHGSGTHVLPADLA